MGGFPNDQVSMSFSEVLRYHYQAKQRWIEAMKTWQIQQIELLEQRNEFIKEHLKKKEKKNEY